ncbi:MAG: carboxymuconolactone decarboxylase family protein [bacterium]
MTKTPAEVSDELYDKISDRFNEEQIVELSALAAWENYRARFNRSFDLQPQGFSEGATCPIPEQEPKKSAKVD